MGRIRILHRIPGRLRLGLPAGADPREVVSALEGQSGFRSWRWNRRTRSLLLLYDAGNLSGETVLDLAASRLGAAAGVDGNPAAARREGPPALAVAISAGMAELDGRVSAVTRGILDLRLLFPLGLFLWGLRDLSRGSVAPLAWSSALWYAHGLFRDYNLPNGDA